jgi:hypothetical protein
MRVTAPVCDGTVPSHPLEASHRRPALKVIFPAAGRRTNYFGRAGSGCWPRLSQLRHSAAVHSSRLAGRDHNIDTCSREGILVSGLRFTIVTEKHWCRAYTRACSASLSASLLGSNSFTDDTLSEFKSLRRVVTMSTLPSLVQCDTVRNSNSTSHLSLELNNIQANGLAHRYCRCGELTGNFTCI